MIVIIRYSEGYVSLIIKQASISYNFTVGSSYIIFYRLDVFGPTPFFYISSSF